MLLIFYIITFFAGCIATASLVTKVVFDTLHLSISTIVGFAVISLASTGCYLFARWLRWHHHLRLFNQKIPVRKSLHLYTETFLLRGTPLFLGEVLRSHFFKKLGVYHPTRTAIKLWFFDFTLDVTALATLFFLFNFHWITLLSLFDLSVICLTIISLLCSSDMFSLRRFPDLFSLILSFIIWLIPTGIFVIGGKLIAEIDDYQLSAITFIKSTLIADASFLPFGIGVFGETVFHFTKQSSLLIVFIILFRTTTLWFLLSISFIAFWSKRKQRPTHHEHLSTWGGVEHFNQLASSYRSEISEDIQKVLITKKTTLMISKLRDLFPQQTLSGLDLGCGQGWYVQAMREQGMTMHGCDNSEEQIRYAREYVQKQKIEGYELQVASATNLPYADNSFDFVYSINVLHHILAPQLQQSAFNEITRVLKPGGVFFLHEMNMINPVFRFYINYLFPLLKRIDEGTELWLDARNLPNIKQASWSSELHFFTFIPDFLPTQLLAWSRSLETTLEQSRFNKYGAHFLAYFTKNL